MPALLSAAIDAVLVVAFAVAGRISHDEAGTPGGVLATAWPFLAGLAIGWVIVMLWRRRPAQSLADGVVVWIATVAAGMLLRRLTGYGTAIAFVIVATIMLGILLLGWRAIAARTARSRPVSPVRAEHPSRLR